MKRKKKVKSFEEMSIKERRKKLREVINEKEGYSGSASKDDLADEFANPSDEPSSTQLELMRFIWSTEPMGFFDLCNALRKEGKCPIKGDKSGWATLFITLSTLEYHEWIFTSKRGKNIEFLQLTPLGADKVREYADGNRPIFQVEEEASKEVFDPSAYRPDPDIPF